MSGIEVAGLVLGAFPLIVSIFHNYDCARLRCSEFETRLRELELDMTSIRSACDRLSIEVEKLSTSILQVLRESPKQLDMISSRAHELLELLMEKQTVQDPYREAGQALGRSSLQHKEDACEHARNLVQTVSPDLSVLWNPSGGRLNHMSDRISQWLFDPTPEQFIITFTCLCVCLALLYRRRINDRYQEVIVAGSILVVSLCGWLRGVALIAILLRFIPSTILISLLASEALHRLYDRETMKRDVKGWAKKQVQGIQEKPSAMARSEKRLVQEV